ncbi:MAG TPA: Spy/CpxP family protein refolding chaperone [Ramlibacter sp.]|nr:Spy/CpxP family protein refolding chaperone [Ramlibacter sp.]
MNKLHRTLLAAGLCASLGAVAVAQVQTSPAPAAAPQAQQMQRGMQAGHGDRDPARMEQRRARMQQRVAQRLGELKAQLRITAAQEGAWTAWTTTLQPGARNFQRPDRAEFARLSTPERIDRVRALRAARTAEMDKRLDATKTFYGALTSEQKAVFDAVGMNYMGGKGRGGFRGHHGHRGHHHRG